jgi:hypothetical protein
MRVIAAMMLAVLVFVPAADALTCIGETSHAAPAAASAAAVAGSLHLHADGDAHGLCGHGHCHGHGTYARLDHPVVERAIRADSPIYLIPADARRGLYPADGPERPPRA